jgi:hypothetical protein
MSTIVYYKRRGSGRLDGWAPHAPIERSEGKITASLHLFLCGATRRRFPFAKRCHRWNIFRLETLKGGAEMKIIIEDRHEAKRF